MPDPYVTLLDDTVTIIDALAFTLDINGTTTPVTVEKRKLPTAKETLDTLPLIAVVPDPRPVRDAWWDTETRIREYAIGIAIIVAGDQDTRKDLDTYLGWRRSLQVAFGKEEPFAMTDFLRLRVIPEMVVDRKLFNHNYDYIAMALVVSIVEAP